MENFDIAVYAYDIATGRATDLPDNFKWVFLSYEVSFSTDYERSASKIKQIGIHPCTKEEFETKFPDYNGDMYSFSSCVDDLEGIEIWGRETYGGGSMFDIKLYEIEC